MQKSAIVLVLSIAFYSIPISAQSENDACTINSYSRIVDGSTFWNSTDQGMSNSDPQFQGNCELDQFSLNNFLYLVGDDGDGHPRFMSYAPWYIMLPSKGEPPIWTGTYIPLNPTKLSKNEAGDSYELLDVNNQSTS